MELKANWNYRILIVDDEAGIHSDFKDMLNPSGAQPSTDQLAVALLGEGAENKSSFLPDLELFHARSGEQAAVDC